MMLVEINLLPKKEHKKSSQLIIAILILLFFTMSFSVIFIQGNSYSSKIDSVDKQIESLQKLNAAQETKMTDVEAGNSVVKLQEALIWAEQYPMETVPLMQNIITLLPERGFIKNFEYSNLDSVLITIQFDSTRDAAFYLSSLKQSEWVQEAALLKVMAVTMEEKTEKDETDTSINNSEEEKILPRYSAEYKITFKPEFYKKNSDAVSKGGDGT
jgi:type IV pilus assembly protein PilN